MAPSGISAVPVKQSGESCTLYTCRHHQGIGEYESGLIEQVQGMLVISKKFFAFHWLSVQTQTQTHEA